MSKGVQDILTAYAAIGVQMLKNAVPKVTGKTANSIRSEVSENRLKIFGREFFRALETGRSPRESSSYSNFDSNLEGWLKAKGFPTKKSKTGITYYKLGDQWFSAKSLAWKINKEGDKTFRQGGKEVYFELLEKWVKELTQKVADQKAKDYAKQVANLFNGINSNQTA